MTTPAPIANEWLGVRGYTEVDFAAGLINLKVQIFQTRRVTGFL